MSQSANRCKKHAAECRELARGMRRQSEREAMENIAVTWDMLAAGKAKLEKRDDEGCC